MRKHVIEMDVARALATIAVIVIHCTATPLGANPHGGRATLAYLLMNVGARFAVPAFIVLSGAGLSLSNRDNEGYLRFLRSRLSKIIPAYLIWSVVYAIAYNPGEPVYLFFKGILTGQANYHLYFVPLITFLYLLFPLLHRAMKTVAGLVVFGAITLFALYVNTYVGYPREIQFLQFAGNPLNWLFYMAFGVWLAKPEVINKLTNERFRHLSTAAFVIWLGVMVGVAHSIMVKGADINSALAPISLYMMPYTVLFFIWVYKQKWSSPMLDWLRWISRHSFAIYLAHPLLLMIVLRRVYPPLPHYAVPHYGLDYGLVGLVTALGGASLLSAFGVKAKKWLLHASEPKTAA